MAQNVLYVRYDDKGNFFEASGVIFQDVVYALNTNIQNLMILSGAYLGDESINNFEAILGKKRIECFINERSYKFGDMCCIDFGNKEEIQQLGNQQIAELLFMAHMKKPFASPFFEDIKNTFVFMCHDDGYWCKVYTKEPSIISKIIKSKLNIKHKLSEKNCELIEKMSRCGLYIDLTDVCDNKFVKLYDVGIVEDIDSLINNPISFIRNEAILKY